MIPLILIFLSFLISFYISPYLPTQMASHWDINGQVNGYSYHLFGLYFLPTLTLALFFLFKLLPKIDPYKKNFNQFKTHYQNFVIIITAFLIYIHFLTLFWNLGYQFNFIQFFTPGIAILFFYTGILTQNARRNWFVGIRTPWTLSSDKVWKQTHSVGGQLFKAVALISLLGIIWPNLAIYFLLGPMLFTVCFVFVYSYWLYSHK